jgi:hypothetical protein
LTPNAAASVTDLKLIEVTIAPDFTSTPVPGGECLTLDSYSFVSGGAGGAGSGGAAGSGGGGGSCLNDAGGDFCGGKSADGCFCDDLCEQFGDCCPDKNQVCDGAGGSGGAGSGGAAGSGGGGQSCLADGGGDFCGGKSDDGCFCDDLCEQFGDCCPDKAQVCDGAGGAGGAGGSAGNAGQGGSGGSPACVEIKVNNGLTASQDLNGDIFGYTSTAVSPDVAVVGGLDEFQLQLYGTSIGLPALVPGTFNLGAGIETNFATCAHCVLLFGLDGDGAVSKTFFQESGTLNLTDVDDPLSADAAASISTLKLVEVTIAPDFTSTPVPGGQCLTLSNYSFDSAPLVPASIRRLSRRSSPGDAVR